MQTALLRTIILSLRIIEIKIFTRILFLEWSLTSLELLKMQFLKTNTTNMCTND